MQWAIHTHGSVKKAVSLIAAIQFISTAPQIVGWLILPDTDWIMWLPSFVMPVILIALLITQHGWNPLNWWAFFHGHIVTVAEQHCVVYSIATQTLFWRKVSPEVNQWLQETIKGRYIELSRGRLQFFSKRDASLTKLIWA